MSLISREKKDYLTRMIKNNNIEGNIDEHYLWLLNCVDYFFYNNNIGPKDIRDHWTDGQYDFGIDYVFYANNCDKIYLIQGKSEERQRFNGIKNTIRDMSDAIKIFDDEKETSSKVNKKLIRAYKKGIINKTKKDIILVLFTNTILTDKLKKEIDSWKKDVFNEYKVLIYGREEIEEKEAYVISGEKTVDSDFLECYDDNILRYNNGDNSGIILNIKANSLRNLYQTQRDNGLFGYNLREKIDGKLDVDLKISTTIERDRENFWFYNNGITIGCDNYTIRDNKIYLRKFSIINGAQTTYIVGNSKDIDNERDFSIVCKVVKSPGSLDNNFVKNISIASNSQKEIEARDLYSNSLEQIQLQYRFMKNEYPLAVTIKRGVKPRNYNSVKPWEKIENTKLGQIILAALLQRPGTARNTPNYIFTDAELYNNIFDLKVISNYNYNLIHDIVWLHGYYESYKLRIINKKKEKKLKEKDGNIIRKLTDEIGVLQNSGFTMISILLYLVKRRYFGLSKITGSRDEDWIKFSNTKIDTNIFTNFRKNKKNLDKIFEDILNILFNLYAEDVLKPDANITSPSNYFKRDELYRKNIINVFNNLIDIDSDNEIFKLLDLYNDEKEN